MPPLPWRPPLSATRWQAWAKDAGRAGVAGEGWIGRHTSQKRHGSCSSSALGSCLPVVCHCSPKLWAGPLSFQLCAALLAHQGHFLLVSVPATWHTLGSVLGGDGGEKGQPRGRGESITVCQDRTS